MNISLIIFPTTKGELMRFVGSKNISSNFIDKLHVNIKPLYDLFQDKILIQWNEELKTLFQQIK